MSNITRRTSLKLGLAAIASAPLVVATTQAAKAATHQVIIEGFAFNPPELAVAVGDTVVFINQDGAPHTATSVEGAFDTGTLGEGVSGKITITEAGEYEYRCNFHPSMVGVIAAG